MRQTSPHVSTLIFFTLCRLIPCSATRADDSTNYFPPRTFVIKDGRSADASDMVVDLRCSAVLRTMKEPSLWELAKLGKPIESYRLLGCTARGQPVAVRIVRTAEGTILKTVQLEGGSSYEIVYERQTPLSDDQWGQLVRAIERARFWDMPASIEQAIADGEDFVVEGVIHGKYHVVDRLSPGPGPYRDLCHLMLKLGGLDLRPRKPMPLAWAWVALCPLVIALCWALFRWRAGKVAARKKKGKPGWDEFHGELS